jgi:hypothetical protein
VWYSTAVSHVGVFYNLGVNRSEETCKALLGHCGSFSADAPESTLMDEQTVAWHVMCPAPPSFLSRVVGIVRFNKSQLFACLLGTVVQSDKETGHDSP